MSLILRYSAASVSLLLNTAVDSVLIADRRIALSKKHSTILRFDNYCYHAPDFPFVFDMQDGRSNMKTTARLRKKNA
jgi:hypothetical protein